MDLTALIEWAKSFDTKKAGVDLRHDMRAKTYLGMIVEKGNKVFFNNDQTQKYMDNIQEYLEQLEKIGVTPQKKEIPVDSGDAKADDTATESPLIP